MSKSIMRLCSLACIILLIASSCKKDLSEDWTQATPTPSTEAEDTSLVSSRVSATAIETQPPVQTAITANITSNCGGYYRALPAKYSSTTQKYPLIIFIHGQSALGDGSATALTKISGGPYNLIKKKTFPANFNVNGQNFSFIVISPQFKKWPTADDVDAVVKYFVARLRIDPSRIYITGLSMGGGATWDYAGKYAAKIAAIAPVCGASSPSDAKAKVIASNNLPVWAFHNKGDNKVPASNSTGYVNKINALKPAKPARLSLWDATGHDAWTKAYSLTYKENNRNVYEWLLQYKR